MSHRLSPLSLSVPSCMSPPSLLLSLSFSPSLCDKSNDLQFMNGVHFGLPINIQSSLFCNKICMDACVIDSILLSLHEVLPSPLVSSSSSGLRDELLLDLAESLVHHFLDGRLDGGLGHSRQGIVVLHVGLDVLALNLLPSLFLDLLLLVIPEGNGEGRLLLLLHSRVLLQLDRSARHLILLSILQLLDFIVDFVILILGVTEGTGDLIIQEALHGFLTGDVNLGSSEASEAASHFGLRESRKEGFHLRRRSKLQGNSYRVGFDV
mmetsp:Transcript_39878/g.78631  ORF Transcript_39878/g.78631 Transcript_39878/m.78631 type:complete len:265 (-) Transcript_39878:35-829(-)